ncbi:MAG: hypothetical protein NTW32_05915 [Chloroflexi bacterium]|nr:hypothetical protein [Chloroflexota bacterium]
MKQDFWQLLNSTTILTDGAMGTMLNARGVTRVVSVSRNALMS